MLTISTADARGVYTKVLAAVYKERPKVFSFLRSFFPSKEYSTLEISIEVERGTEKIAVDVLRGTEGNRNMFSKSTEKNFIPPYYREFFDSTDLRLYDRMFGSSEISMGVFNNFIEEVADKVGRLQDKIERSYELQCAQVLETGIVLLNAGTNIDFKRKAGSKVDASSNTWATGSNSPYTDLKNGAVWLRENGRVQGGVFNVIMGSSVLSAFLSNTTVQSRNDLKNMQLDGISGPQRNAVGATFHGFVSEGSYIFRIWSYPELYETAAGVKTKYVNDKKFIMLPESPNFQMSFAAVPQLITDGGPIRTGAFIFDDYKDQKLQAHEFHVRSAGVALPISVDQVYTAQVLV